MRTNKEEIKPNQAKIDASLKERREEITADQEPLKEEILAKLTFKRRKIEYSVI
jgi:hypothetical protein